VSVRARVDCAEALGALLWHSMTPGEPPLALPTLLSLLDSSYASQVQVSTALFHLARRGSVRCPFR